MKHPPLRKRIGLSAAMALSVLAGLSARAEYQSTVLSQSPVGYWRLNETTQPLPPPVLAVNAGSVGASGNGTYTNNAIRGVSSAAIASEPGNLAVQLNATTDGNRVRIPFASQWDPIGPFTVELWAKPAQTTATACAAANVFFIATPTQRDGWLIYQSGSTSQTALTDGNGFVFRHYNSTGLAAFNGAYTNIALNTTKWYHVVGVYDGTNLKIYVNGILGQSIAFSGTPRVNTNTAIPLTFGARADGASGFFSYNGQIDETAVYNVALSAAEIAAHYEAGTNPAPAISYSATILAHSPVGYWRLNEAGDPSVANLGSLGAAKNGKVLYSASVGTAGPTNTAFPGLDATNTAVTFDGSGFGSVQIPALNLNTNAFTMTCWIKPNGSQPAYAGVVSHRSKSGAGGTDGTTAGLIIDAVGGLSLTYNWDGDRATYNFASGVGLIDGVWNFATLIVQPDKAIIYIPGQTPGTNYNTHAALEFQGTTYIGQDPYTAPNGPSTRAFNGSVDELAIFNRALSLGEAYTQYADAVGGLPPALFGDPQAPVATLYAGDALALSVDAGGTPNLTYQWRKNTIAIGGATASSYTVPSLTTGDNGSYDAVISNGFGSTNSAAAAISVSPAVKPVITQNIVATSRTLYAAGAIKLAIAATGGGVTYQWKKGGSDILGKTNSSLVINNITGTDAGTYSCAVSNGAGSVSSANCVITVASPAAGSFDANVAADVPLNWYRMDDSTYPALMLDAMGRSDGFYTNLVSAVTLGAAGAIVGSPNTSASFDKANKSWGEVTTPPITTGDFTIECWAKMNDTSTDDLGLVSSFRYQYGEYIYRRGSDNVWRGADGYGDLDGTTPSRSGTIGPAVDSQWVQLIISYSAATGFKHYINGLWDNGGPFVDFSRNRNIPFRIGCVEPYTGGLEYFWSGQIDEVQVYDKALTDDRISAHYQAAKYAGTTLPFWLQQPATQVVTIGTTVNFVGVADGSYPIRYQWFKNGNAVANATNTTLTVVATNLLAVPDSFQLRATNGVGTNFSVTATLTVMSTNPPYALVTNDLILHLKFDGNYSDSSGRGNNATQVGSPSIGAGVLGSGSLFFSTINSVPEYNYLTLGTPTDFLFGSSVNFSVAYWVKTSVNQTNGDLPFLCNATNSYGNPGISIAPSFNQGGWSYSLNGITQIYGAPNSINNGSWHHIVHSFDRTGYATTYRDGVQVDQRLMTLVGNVDTGAPFNIGQDPSGNYSEDGSGNLDDLGVWRRALTAYDAYAMYRVGTLYGKSFDVFEPIVLSITTSGANVLLNWPGGTLLQATNVVGPWTPVAGAVAPNYTTPATATQRFYRVQL